MINMIKKCSIIVASALLLFSFTISNAIADDDNHHKADKRHNWLSSEKLQKTLDLDEDQQAAWADAKNQIKELHAKFMPKFKAAKQKAKDAIDTEAAKKKPDLAVLFSVYQDMKQDFSGFREKAQKIQLNLYNKLTADQKKIVFSKATASMSKTYKDMKKDKRKSHDDKDDSDDDDNGDEDNGDAKEKKKGWW